MTPSWRTSLEEGFTAVELLITLFIASLFLFSGYQLYAQVSQDGSDAEKMAKLSNITYERAQKAGATASSGYPYGCDRSSQAGPTEEEITGIGKVTFTTKISCPHGNTAKANLFYVQVTAKYKNNGIDRELQHAIYTN